MIKINFVKYLLVIKTIFLTQSVIIYCRAHKTHYCSTRHVVKDSVPTPATPQSSVKASPPTSSSPGDSPPPQPCLALPTNPPIVLPYTVFRGASVLAAPALPLPDTVYYLLPDGSCQLLSIFFRPFRSTS